MTAPDHPAPVLPAHRQLAHPVRVEWGLAGATALAPEADVAVVVDVLSFTTTLSVAVERGMAVEPTPWRGAGEAGSGPRLLSPAAMLGLPVVERLVLPSPNGATICRALVGAGPQVVGACLRNAAAVAAHLAPLVRAGRSVLLVPAGERWPDGSLRPAVEDLWGVGAVLAALVDLGVAPGLSPEARVAEQAFRSVRADLAPALVACASGAELVDKGYAGDVAVAAALDSSRAVPVLLGDVFLAAPAPAL